MHISHVERPALMARQEKSRSVHVVLRTANERTVFISEALVRAQCPPDVGVTLIKERPFEKALRACYQAGLDAGQRWTITVDADVMILPGAINGLVKSAETMPQCNVQLEGRVFDKVLGVYRPAGLRIYRTDLLHRAMRFIPPMGQTIRPEYETLLAMGRLGFPSRFVPDIFALHDFEQFYIDLYRKAYVHAYKHSWLVSDLLKRCRDYLKNDPDFLILLKGLWDGLTMNDAVSIDCSLFKEKAVKALQELGFREKEPINVEEFLESFRTFSSEATRGYTVPPKDTCDTPVLQPLPHGFRDSVINRTRKRGFLRGSVASFGAFLAKIGRALDS